MASKFERCITEIDNEISIAKEDRKIYTQDYDAIRDHVLNGMKKVDDVFDQIFGGTSLFGSYIENVRLNKPDEFDLHVMLTLPFYETIIVKNDEYRPGFVTVCLSKVLELLGNSYNDYNRRKIYNQLEHLVTKNKLDREKLQNWIERIINAALDRFGIAVRSKVDNDVYLLEYKKKGTAHTIEGKSKYNSREISIDIVPALKFDGKNIWLANRQYPSNMKDPHWFAVPKPTREGPTHTKNLQFAIAVPQVEKLILFDKNNLKSSMRLFKSLRDKMGRSVWQLSSYFIRSLYLLEEEKNGGSIWNEPVGVILIKMIGRLLEYLDQRNLPFYWCPQRNLLHGLDGHTIELMKQKFSYVKRELENFSRMQQFNPHSLRQLFDIPN